MKLSFLALLIFFELSQAETYSNKVVLKGPDLYTLSWNFNDTDIEFETRVRTNGWASFGLSPTGGMDNSDVVVSWIDTETGSHHFSDRHIRGTSVLVDDTQNWFPISVTSKDGYLISKFTRKIKICDKTSEDMDVPPGTPFVIFAFGENFSNDDISYHGTSRGTQAVPLISSINSPIDIKMDEVETVDFRVNYTFESSKETEYHCKYFKIPNDWTREKRHLIRYETLFAEGNEENLHHWTVSECTQDFEDIALKKNPSLKEGNCFSPEWMEASKYCGKITLVWAVGGGIIQDFPNDLAYPIGGGEKTGKYFIFNIHYDNPRFKDKVRDNTGLRYYVTKNYRKTEFGILTIGTSDTFKGITIPPKTERFKLDYMCTPTCLDKMFDKEPEVKVFSTMPHTHLYGKEIYATVVRDGKEVDYLVNNKYYDFNYQYYNFLSKPVVLKKGDEIRTTCIYNTKNKKEFTYGGVSTNDEMCFAFLWYYPRSDLVLCAEDIHSDKWIEFLNGLKKSGEVEANINLNITDFYNYSEKTLNLKTKYPSKQLVKKFEEFYEFTERSQACLSDQITFSENKPKKIIPIKEDECVPS